MRREADREVTREARWGDATGENLIEQIAAVCDYLVALATYRAAVKRWPNAKSRSAIGRACDQAELAGLTETLGQLVP